MAVVFWLMGVGELVIDAVGVMTEICELDSLTEPGG